MSQPALSQRRSLRLQGYDYAQAGAYFVTICTWQRACTLGEVVDDRVRLSAIGEILISRWHDLPNHHLVELDAFTIMPNHIHGVVAILGGEAGKTGEAGLAPTVGQPKGRKGTLGTIVGSFKSATSKAINERGLGGGAPLWQRGYYEHVIRSEQTLTRIRQYIIENPAKWALDEENPQRRATR
jgi:putative transposase